MQIWREEVFGPVICIKEFRTESEAVELANDTQWVTIAWSEYGKRKRKPFHAYIIYSPSLPILFSYGLAGAVISNDEERCERISKVT